MRLTQEHGATTLPYSVMTSTVNAVCLSVCLSIHSIAVTRPSGALLFWLTEAQFSVGSRAVQLLSGGTKRSIK